MFTIQINGICIHCVSIIFLLVLVCLLVSAVHLFISPTSADLYVVVDLPAHCALLSNGQASSGQMAGTTISAFLFHRDSSLCSWLYLSHLCTFLPMLILSKSFVLLNLFTMADYDFVASTFLAHTKISSLDTFSVSSVFVSCFIISIIMSSSFHLCINCFVSVVCPFLYNCIQ